MVEATQRYTRITTPEELLVTLDEAKSVCSVFGNDLDALLSSLIVEATATVEQMVNKSLLLSQWKLTFDYFPNEILVKRPPVRSVLSIVYKDLNGNLHACDPEVYQVSLGGWKDPARIKPVMGMVWPITAMNTYEAVTVHFAAGADSPQEVPPGARRAVKFLVAHWFRNRETVGTVTNDIKNTLDLVLAMEDWGDYE